MTKAGLRAFLGCCVLLVSLACSKPRQDDKAGVYVTVPGVGVGITAPTVAALTALAKPGAPQLAQVTTNLGYYLYDPPSSTWVRTRWGHDTWRAQATWYVDYAAGSDEATCADASNPCQTIREISYRLGGLLTQPTTINLVGTSWPATDPLSLLTLTVNWNTTLSPSTPPSLTILGTVTTTRTGTIATAAVPVPASNLASQVSDTGDAGTTNWTADVSSMLVVTSGAASGAFAWVLKDIGSNTARLTRWTLITGATSAAPSAADTYKIATVTTVPDELPLVIGHVGTAAGGNSYLTIKNVTFAGTLNVGKVTGTHVSFVGCKFAFGVFVSEASVRIFGSIANGIISTGSAAYTSATNTACYGSGGNMTFSIGASGTLSDVIMQVVSLNIFDGATAKLTNVAVFDNTVSSGLGALSVYQNGTATINTAFYGSGNTQACAVLRGGGLWVATITPTATGTTELTLAQAATAIPPITAGLVVPAASALTTWANWAAAPFSKNVVSYKDGSWIDGT